jgi:hypothetical protein
MLHCFIVLENQRLRGEESILHHPSPLLHLFFKLFKINELRVKDAFWLILTIV